VLDYLVLSETENHSRQKQGYHHENNLNYKNGESHREIVFATVPENIQLILVLFHHFLVAYSVVQIVVNNARVDATTVGAVTRQTIKVLCV